MASRSLRLIFVIPFEWYSYQCPTRLGAYMCLTVKFIIMWSIVAGINTFASKFVLNMVSKWDFRPSNFSRKGGSRKSLFKKKNMKIEKGRMASHPHHGESVSFLSCSLMRAKPGRTSGFGSQAACKSSRTTGDGIILERNGGRRRPRTALLNHALTSLYCSKGCCSVHISHRTSAKE